MTTRNIGDDGLPLLYSAPHDSECECMMHRVDPETGLSLTDVFVDAMAKFQDAAGVADEEQQP